MRGTKSRNTGLEKSQEEILVSVVLTYLNFFHFDTKSDFEPIYLFYRKRFFKSVFTIRKSIILTFI